MVSMMSDTSLKAILQAIRTTIKNIYAAAISREDYINNIEFLMAMQNSYSHVLQHIMCKVDLSINKYIKRKRVRHFLNKWYIKTSVKTCAKDGIARKRDQLSFESEFIYKKQKLL
jgi:hypothetical protein